MIRRNVILPGGTSAWLLIAQIEHARVAFEIARDWGASPFVPLCPRTLLFKTILRHDNGWRRWERYPEIDPSTGCPLDFTEMPAQVAQEIWESSIDACSDIGPLAQYLTVAHFLHLRSRGDSAGTNIGGCFLTEFRFRSERWLQQWKWCDPESHTDQLALSALRYLQLFDAISLWLCCAEQTESRRFQDPDGQTIELLPTGSRRVIASPWPLTVADLRIDVTGRLVPVRDYQNAADLDSVTYREFSLDWQLVPQQ